MGGNPSHNVVTHSEWIAREHFPSMMEIAEKKFAESVEARTWQQYANLQVDEAIVLAHEWALEEPYAKNAFCLGSFLAFHKNDYNSGIKILENGLKAAPHDFMLQNNLCFGLLKANRVNDAEIEFARMPRAESPVSQVIFSATNGLLEFKRGNIELGRNLYFESVMKAKEIGDRRVFESMTSGAV